MNDISLQFEIQRLQDLAHGTFIDISSEKLIDLLRLKRKGSLFLRIGIHIDDAVHDFAATEKLNELTCTLDSFQSVFRIQPLFVSCGSICTHSERGGGTAYGCSVKVCRFKENHGSIANNLGISATHDTGYCDRFFRITDAEHVSCQFTVGSVQCRDGLAFFCKTDMDLAIFYTGEIKSMHRLAIFHHDIVRNINNVVDGSHPAGTDPLSEPFGRGADLNIAYHPAGVAFAQFRFVNDDGCVIFDPAFRFRFDLRGMKFQFTVEGRRSFSCKTNHA